MSFLIIEQDPDRIRGRMLYDANPDWGLDCISHDDSFHCIVRTEEGDGSWLIFDRTNPRTIAVLRSHDAPYNDCLPPAESLILEGFQSERATEDQISKLDSLANGGFFNPFTAVFGDLTTESLQYSTISFQSERRSLEPGMHVLTDQDEPDQCPWSPLSSLSSFPTSGEFHSMIKNLESPDGIRQPRRAAEFEVNETRWTVTLTKSPASSPEEEQFEGTFDSE